MTAGWLLLVGAALSVASLVVEMGDAPPDDDGLYAGKPAYDDVAQAVSGLAMLQTVVSGEPFSALKVTVSVLTVHCAKSVVSEVIGVVKSHAVPPMAEVYQPAKVEPVLVGSAGFDTGVS